MRQKEISHGMFPNYPINSVTNGVHAATWTSLPFAELYDRHIPEWRRDNLYLRYSVAIPVEEIQSAHLEAKKDLISMVAKRTGIQLEKEAMTIGFARRATAYKRANFLFSDIDRLRKIVRTPPCSWYSAAKRIPKMKTAKKSYAAYLRLKN
jgi:starch phosphorylase